MSLTIPISILFVHLLADWYAQSDWMALNKSKNWKALTLHVGVYAPFFLWWGVPFVLITFITHWLTDFVTSRITSRLWFFDLMEPIGGGPMWRMKPMFHRRHWFFVAIGTDQFIHAVTLALTLKYLS